MSSAKPFLKWAGGKSRLLPSILERMPARGFPGWYFEPFVGGGAVFFAIKGEALDTMAAIADTNKDLIDTYHTVSRQPEDVISQLSKIRHSKKSYYEWRDEKRFTSPVMRAVRFIYLNKTCFNGLYRVNRSGKFNVPMGSYKHPVVCDADAIRAASRVLASSTRFRHQTFLDTIDAAGRGDFVYCDPPYLPKSETAEFTNYTIDGFSIGDHQQLHDVLKRATKRGVKWMLSEGDSPFIRKLFKGCKIMSVTGRHSVSAAGASRVESKELLITNYNEFQPWPVTA